MAPWESDEWDIKKPARALLQYMRKHPDLDQLRNNPTRVLEAIDDFSAQHNFLVTIGTEKGKVITDVIAKEKPEVMAELGSYVGYSAILFVNEMRKHQPDAHLWSLEFEPEFADIIREMVTLAGLQDHVTVVVGAADESMRKLKADGKIDTIDMLFLDHVEDLYVQDLKVAMDELVLLKGGSTIAADNVLMPGAPAYKKYVKGHPRLSTKSVKRMITPIQIEVCSYCTSIWKMC